MKKAAASAAKSWKTTLAGILTLAFAGISIWNDPSKIGNPETVAAIGAGIGLIAAKDSNVTGK